MHPRFHRGGSYTLWRGKELVHTREFGSGYEHEVIHVVQYLAQGMSESPVMPLADTLTVQRLSGGDQTRSIVPGSQIRPERRAQPQGGGVPSQSAPQGDGVRQPCG